MGLALGSLRRLAAASVKQAPTAARPSTPRPARPAPLDSAATRVSLGNLGMSRRKGLDPWNWAEPSEEGGGGRYGGPTEPQGACRGTGL